MFHLLMMSKWDRLRIQSINIVKRLGRFLWEHDVLREFNSCNVLNSEQFPSQFISQYKFLVIESALNSVIHLFY